MYAEEYTPTACFVCWHENAFRGYWLCSGNGIFNDTALNIKDECISQCVCLFSNEFKSFAINKLSVSMESMYSITAECFSKNSI